MPLRKQTPKEEIWNTVTHAVGVALCLVGMAFLYKDALHACNLFEIIALIAFFVGMLLVYGFSTAYHFARNPQRKKMLNKFDHISIYFLIAGTYSPLMAKYLPTRTAIIFLSIMWGIVFVGILYKILFIDRWRWFSVTTYLLMGWMIVFVIKPLIHSIPLSIFCWILAGGISYTVGVYFYVKHRKKYFHTVWHFFVLLGTIFHFIAIYKSYAV